MFDKTHVCCCLEFNLTNPEIDIKLPAVDYATFVHVMKSTSSVTLKLLKVQ